MKQLTISKPPKMANSISTDVTIGGRYFLLAEKIQSDSQTITFLDKIHGRI